jgi:cyclic pyranopterin phosphate synthase
MDEFTHTDSEGKAHMIDVSSKPLVRRTAVASGRIHLQPKTIELLKENGIKKGDVLTVAKLAGIMGAKKTSELIPLCHGIHLEHIGLEMDVTDEGVEIKAYASTSYKTGVEMEALTAVSVSALTIYDMCKAVDKEMVITDISLLEKRKGDITD